jgi:phage FluMu protein Com
VILFLWPINFSHFGIKCQKCRNLETFYKKDMKVSARVGQRIDDTDRVVVEALPLP